MKIRAHTKIASIVQAHPDALEAIIGISKKFEALRSPILYKLMAKRTSVSMACKVSGCKMEDFNKALSYLGFEFEEDTEDEFPLDNGWNLEGNFNLIKLDVRPILADNRDPLKLILAQIDQLKDGELLEIINSFMPYPLINLLSKKGYKYRVVENAKQCVRVQFCGKIQKVEIGDEVHFISDSDWEMLVNQYKDVWEMIDVRNMVMPMPMITILQAVDELKPKEVLFVRHHKFPVFLLPELEDRKVKCFAYRINEAELNLILIK